jgi:hypothetical protein
MSKRVTIIDCDGNRHDYQSSIFRGYHAVESDNGVCVVEKRLFRSAATVSCYPDKCETSSLRVERDDCTFCALVNPTQRRPY